EIKYQILKIIVPSQGALVTVNSNTDMLYKDVCGMLLTVPFEVLPHDRSLCSIVINEREIFPEDFEMKLLVSDVSIAVNERMYTVHADAQGSTVKVKYKDGSMPGQTYSYDVHLYLKLEGKI